ncbi:MAG: vitamin K epoxide reductase family protein [Candidatus Saccharimonadales bacterium]
MPSNPPHTTSKLNRVLPYILLIGGIIGIICSFVITIEKISLLQNPSYVPSCNLNPIISCGSVMASKQANTFGFANPIIGLVAFGALAAIGAGLLAGASFKRWYWLAIQVGTIFGVGFVHYLFFQSTYRIGALCPYCIVVWIVTITTFWYVLQYNLAQRNLVLPSKYGPRVTVWLQRHHLDILILWIIVIAFFIIKHFWYYFGKNF